MKRKLSALVDNHLDERTAHLVFDTLRKDSDLRQTWDAYCLIGDVMHRGEVVVKTDFTAQVMAGIDEQPTLFTPAVHHLRRTEQTMWQRMLPVAASVMGFAAVGWVAGSLYADHGDGGTAPLAVATSGSGQGEIVPASVSVVVHDSRHLKEESPYETYLFAHQSMTGAGGIQYVDDAAVTEVEESQ